MEVTVQLHYEGEANPSITNEKNGYEKGQKANHNSSVIQHTEELFQRLCYPHNGHLLKHFK
jgi:hypothetical protein